MKPEQTCQFIDPQGKVRAIAAIRQMGADSDAHTFEAHYPDGSGSRGAWALTERGAKISASNAARQLVGYFGRWKAKWTVKGGAQ